MSALWWVLVVLAVLCVTSLVAAVLATPRRAVCRRLRPDAAGQAREVAGLCEDAARSGAELELRPWDWALPEVVLADIARSRGLTPDGPAGSPWGELRPLRLAAAGGSGDPR